MSEHLRYDILASNALAVMVGTEGRSSQRDFPRLTPDWWRGNALIEAQLLHVRSLDEFFYGDVIKAAADGWPERIELRDNHVSALHYVRSAQEWLGDRPSRPEELESVWKRINRTVLHLSWFRLQSGWSEDHNPFGKEQDWTYWNAWDALKPTIRAFLRHADDGRLCDGFRYEVHEALVDRSVAEDSA